MNSVALGGCCWVHYSWLVWCVGCICGDQILSPVASSSGDFPSGSSSMIASSRMLTGFA